MYSLRHRLAIFVLQLMTFGSVEHAYSTVTILDRWADFEVRTNTGFDNNGTYHGEDIYEFVDDFAEFTSEAQSNAFNPSKQLGARGYASHISFIEYPVPWEFRYFAVAAIGAEAQALIDNGANTGTAAGRGSSSTNVIFSVDPDSVNYALEFTLVAAESLVNNPRANSTAGLALHRVTWQGEDLQIQETLFERFVRAQTDVINQSYDSISSVNSGRLGPGMYLLSVNADANAFAGVTDGIRIGKENRRAKFAVSLDFGSKREVKVVDALDAPLANTTLSLSKVGNNAPTFSESLQQEITTDSTGRFTIPTDFEIGDSIKISKLIHAEPSKKHIGLLGTMYSVTIDNAHFDSIGVMSFTELLDTAEQSIMLDHTTIAYNLLVSMEWDAATEYLERTQTAFRNMSNYLYDISDGQARFDTIMIVDDKELWELADFQIYASNAVWPHVDQVGGQFRPVGANSDPVEMPRYWNSGADSSRNLVQSDSALDLTVIDEFRTRVHEYGHYGLKLGDEYVFTTAAGQCAAISNYGFMYSQYQNLADPYTTEMSNAGRYASAACQNNNHWALYGQSCWGLFESDYENFYGPDNIYAEIYQPAERTLPAGVDYIAGPNDEAALTYDVGALVVFPYAIAAPAAEAVDIIVTNPATGTR